MSEHSIAAAMARGELTEEEAYFVLRFAGHQGYDKAIRKLSPQSWYLIGCLTTFFVTVFSP